MLRSMYSGVSGLRVHQTKMDVIGNNIANVNTVGFKKSQVTFQEIYNQTIKGAGSPQGGRGGTNPQQVGLGVNIATMTVIHSRGPAQMTNNKTDLMIDGNGYFVLSNDENSQNRFYTRAGNFTLDKFGYLVAPNGYKLLDINMKPIQINMSATKAATATTEIEITGNLNLNDSDIYETTIDVYDNLGDVHTLTIEFGPTQFSSTFPESTYRQINVYDENNNLIPFGDGNSRYIKFDYEGKYQGIYIDTNADTLGTDSTITLGVPGTKDIILNFNDDVFRDDNGNPLLTNQSNNSDAKAIALNGNSAGSLDDFSISSNGEIMGIFTNGEKDIIAKIGLADFDNPAGLLKVGNNLFINSSNSGTPKYGEPSSGSFGDLIPMALEMSNVDLSQEFTEMITTQRGFQANSRIITTSDEMLQELVNLKR